MKKNVLITGGTGFIGKQLTNLLIDNGYSVSILSRNSKRNTDIISYYKWDVANHTIDENSVMKADYIIHLAGEGIAEGRWTTSRKEAIVQSREQSIRYYRKFRNSNRKNSNGFSNRKRRRIFEEIGSYIQNEIRFSYWFRKTIYALDS